MRLLVVLVANYDCDRQMLLCLRCCCLCFSVLQLCSWQHCFYLCVNLRLVSQNLGQEIDWHLITILEAEFCCLRACLLYL